MTIANYDPPMLTERLSAMLAATFPEDALPTPEELAGFDQFHTGGLPATIRLAALMHLREDSKVLDVGSGLGGPARYIAATFGSTVTGIDLSVPFVEAARMLTARTGLDRRVTFVAGSALELPFAPASFDAAIMQHVAMNIEDRATLYAGIERVLVPGGRFLTYDVIRNTAEPKYPVPWAPDESASFLRSEAQTRDALVAAGFAIEAWQVDGPEAARALQPPPGTPTPPPLAALLGHPNFGELVANLSASLAEGRVAILTAVLRKP
jgi:SAM-dependent methyltransferase